jgi:ATP-dependent Clp protease protease subunit
MMNKYILAILSLIIVSFPAQVVPAKSDKNTITLTSENVIVINQEISPSTMSKIIQEIQKIDAKTKNRWTKGTPQPIYIFLDTPGGSIQSGLEFIEFIKGLNRPVHTISLFAASMGFHIVQSLGDRLILNNGVFMSHEARGGIEGSFGGQYPSQLENRYGLWIKRMKKLDEIVVQRTKGKQTLESYRKSYAHELWVEGQDAVKSGYADRVVSVVCDGSLSGISTKEMNFMGLVRIQVDFSKCPINTGPLDIRVAVDTNKGPMDLDDFIKKDGKFRASMPINTIFSENDIYTTNPSLTLDKVNDIKREVSEQVIRRPKQVIPMY